MPTMRTARTSFAGGVITPEMFGRFDLDKFQSGLKTCRNFVVLPHGPIANRPGFEFINEVKDSSKATRLIPFSFSTTQTYALEFGDGYIRFHTQGGTLLDTAKNITGITQPAGVVTSNAHGYSNGQWVFLSGIGGMTELNGRFVVVSDSAANTFRMKDTNGNYITTGSYGAYTSGGTVAQVYEVATPYLEADLFDLHFIQNADVMTIVHKNYEPKELRRLSATSWELKTIGFIPTINPPTGLSAATSGPGGGTPVAHKYVVTAIKINTLEESVASPQVGATTKTPTTFAASAEAITLIFRGVQLTTSVAHGYSVGQKIFLDMATSTNSGLTDSFNKKWYKVRAVVDATNVTLNTLDGTAVTVPLGSVSSTVTGTVTQEGSSGTSIDLTVAGNKVNLTWTEVSGAIRYNIYKERGGVYGYIGQAAGLAFSDDNISPDMQVTPPEYRDRFTAPGDFPQAAAYFEQRRIFAATSDNPQRSWMTRAGTESSFLYSIPTRDDDAIDFTIKAREVNEIRHIVPLGDLVYLTSGGEWRVSSGDAQALTPFSIQVRPQSYEGASMVQPVVTGNSALYVQNEGNHIREVTYDWQTQSFRSLDVSRLATHLFDYKNIVDLAFSKGPVPVLWAVRDDGALLGLTYVPREQVVAWHEHDTDGTFESVCSIAENDESALYAVIRRTIDGNTKRYVERLHTRQFATLEDAFFVDSGLTYDGAATTTITGLWHLEGETVAILADGAVHPPRTVADGAITLEAEASVVHVGLPITSDAETLPLTLQIEGFGQGKQKNINKVFLRVYRSSGIFVGPASDKLTEVKQRTDEVYGTPPDLRTDELGVVITPTWGNDGAVFIRQADPLPLTIVSMSLEVAVA